MRRRRPGIIETGRDKKTAMIEIATELFAKKGYYNTSLDEIAKELGVTKGALYYYIRSKEQLLREIINASMVNMNKLISISKSSLSAEDKFRHFVLHHVECGGSELADEGKILFEQANALPKRTRDVLTRKKREVDRALQNILKEGVEEGTFTIDDVKIVSYAIIGLCGWVYHWYRPDGRLAPEQIADKFINLIYSGILCK